MDSGFENKHVVVTGASGGIGLDTVSRFLAEGARVTACYNSDPRRLTVLATEYPEQLNNIAVDVQDESSVSSLFRKANAILYLASDTLAGHVSGQTITVAGGMEGRVLFSKDNIGEYLAR